VRALKYSIFVLLLGLGQVVFALPNSVLSNLNQPSMGTFFRTDVKSWLAVPFTTDTAFTEFRGVEVTAGTLLPPGFFFVEIWDTDVFAQPNNVVQILSGPAAPAGLTTYSANSNFTNPAASSSTEGTHNVRVGADHARNAAHRYRICSEKAAGLTASINEIYRGSLRWPLLYGQQ